MKRNARQIILVAASVLGACFLVWSDTWTTERDFKIDNTGQAVKLTLQNSGGYTNNTIEIYNGGTLKFALPYTGYVPVAYGGTGAGDAATARSNLGVSGSSGGSFTNATLAGGTMSSMTNSDFTASLPVWASATKVLETKSAADTKVALGIQVGTGTTSDDGTVTNTFGTAFGSAPTVIACYTSATNNIVPLGIKEAAAATFVIEGDTNATFNYIAVGAP